MTLYLKLHQKHIKSKLKVQLLSSRFGKLSDIVNMSQEGLVVAALLASVRRSDNLLHKEDFVDSQLGTTLNVNYYCPYCNYIQHCIKS